MAWMGWSKALPSSLLGCCCSNMKTPQLLRLLAVAAQSAGCGDRAAGGARKSGAPSEVWGLLALALLGTGARAAGDVGRRRVLPGLQPCGRDWGSGRPRKDLAHQWPGPALGRAGCRGMASPASRRVRRCCYRKGNAGCAAPRCGLAAVPLLVGQGTPAVEVAGGRSTTPTRGASLLNRILC